MNAYGFRPASLEASGRRARAKRLVFWTGLLSLAALRCTVTGEDGYTFDHGVALGDAGASSAGANQDDDSGASAVRAAQGGAVASDSAGAAGSEQSGGESNATGPVTGVEAGSAEGGDAGAQEEDSPSPTGAGGEAGMEGGAAGDAPDCSAGSERRCDPSMLKGNCAAGHEICGPDGTWGMCDTVPAPSDSCEVEGDDANCNGVPNDGCPCIEGDTQECGPAEETGVCQKGVSTCTDGAWSDCEDAVFPGLRDCGSAYDNDCDGEPDDTIDSVCQCEPGSTGSCDQHPGLDGQGICRAGTRSCVAASNATSSTWGTCMGSVGPGGEICASDGLDEDCDGSANEGCTCLNGATQACGNCSLGTQTCSNGAWGGCENEPGPPQTYYLDFDGDSNGSASSSIQSCDGPPATYVANASDCCDTDSRAKPGQLEYFSDERYGCGGYDFNCDALDEVGSTDVAAGSCSCGSPDGGWVGGYPGCGDPGTYRTCSTLKCDANLDRPTLQYCR